jgi:hypothetical protein
MAVTPKAAMEPQIASAVDIPNPEKSPDRYPLDIVRCKLIIPIGPKGAATIKPIIKPLTKNGISKAV